MILKGLFKMSEYIVKCKEFVSVSGKTIRIPEYIDLNQEIVRCRDCEHYHPELYKHINCEWLMIYMKPNDFCPYGERKDDNHA